MASVRSVPGAKVSSMGEMGTSFSILNLETILDLEFLLMFQTQPRKAMLL
jgi:hypothetical protein